jgi:hypothetical protein
MKAKGKNSNSRSRRTSAASSYRVGRGKPPMHTRWRPGQSGNPSGLPKDRSIGTPPAMMRGLRKKAASGDAAAARLLWQMQQASAAEDSKLSTAEALNTEADKLVVEQLALRLREVIKGEHGENTDTK